MLFPIYKVLKEETELRLKNELYDGIDFAAVHYSNSNGDYTAYFDQASIYKSHD